MFGFAFSCHWGSIRISLPEFIDLKLSGKTSFVVLNNFGLLLAGPLRKGGGVYLFRFAQSRKSVRTPTKHGAQTHVGVYQN